MTVPLMTGMREEAVDVPQGDLGSPKDSEEAEELEMLRLRAVPEDAVCARDVSAEASATNVRDTADALVTNREKLTPGRAADAARLILCVLENKVGGKKKRGRGEKGRRFSSPRIEVALGVYFTRSRGMDEDKMVLMIFIQSLKYRYVHLLSLGSVLLLQDLLDDLLLLNQECTDDSLTHASSAARTTIGTGDVLLTLGDAGILLGPQVGNLRKMMKS